MKTLLRQILGALFPRLRPSVLREQAGPGRPEKDARPSTPRRPAAHQTAAPKRPARQRSARGRARSGRGPHALALVGLFLVMTLSACQAGGGEGTATGEAEPTRRPSPTSEALPTEAVQASEPTPRAATPIARPQSPGEDAYPAPAGEAPPAPAQQATPTQAGTGGYPAPGPGTQQVSIPAAQGLALAATLYTPASGTGPWPGVLLLHMLGSERGAWAEAAAALAEVGYVALAVDLRGHGETGGEVDWELAAEDLRQALAFLAARPEVDPARTAVAGASIGANLALALGAAEPDVRAVVLLSPGLDYQGVTTLEALAEYDGRPLLIVASEGDSYAASSSETLAELAPGGAELELYAGGAHGTSLFPAEPRLIDRIKSWLSAIL